MHNNLFWDNFMVSIVPETILFFLLSSQRKNYKASPPEGIFVNILGLLILIFGALVLWMATRPQWKRPPEQNSKLQQPNGGTEDSAMTDCSKAEKADVEFNSEAAARKRNLKLDETGQRSTM